jgi:hypothetical protein
LSADSGISAASRCQVSGRQRSLLTEVNK